MNKLIIISGPTGVGKTSLAIKLAKILNTEIISADSMQIYKDLNIGTAKVTKSEMQGIKHHMIDIIEPDMNYSVKEFKRDATKIIDELHNKNKIPILVGGTGLYVNSIIYNLDFNENNSDPEIKSILNNILLENGIEYVRELLKYVDFNSYNNLHINDFKRNLRALEYFFCTNKKYSDRKYQFRVDNGKYDWYLYVLTRNREELYNNINDRVDKMFKEGLIEEFNKIKSQGISGKAQSMQAIGYKELVKYYNGEYDLIKAIDLIKQHSRNYAKRQLTWFRNDEKSKFINVENESSELIIKKIMEDINVSN